MASPKQYRERERETVRVVAKIPSAEVEAIDAYGIPAGKRSRTETIRFLIVKGLEAVAAEARRPRASPVHYSGRPDENSGFSEGRRDTVPASEGRGI